MTETVRSSIATRVRSVSSRSRRAPVAQVQSAFRPGWYFPAVVGLGKHLVKHTDMAGIDTNVWPLALRELSSG